jgi:hypothetical protein
MGTAGDHFLRNTLGDDASRPMTVSNPTTGGNGHSTPPPYVPPAERGTAATTDIDEATRRARDAERNRVAEGPPPWWDISHLLPGATGGGSGAPGPGGYKFDAETIAKKITEWQQVLSDLKRDGLGLQHAAQTIDPPSEDEPAVTQAEATRSSINAAVDHNKQMQKYASSYIAALQKANGTYVAQDENASSSLSSDTSGTLYK